MQDRLPPDRRTSCNARPDHTSGSRTVLTTLKRDFRSSPTNGRCKTGSVGPVRANTRSRGHHSIISSARTSSDDGAVNPSALARIDALLQDKTSMTTASTATICRRRSTPLGFEAALSRTGTDASARACARLESAASEAVTSWSLTSPLAKRISGSNNFRSSPKNDFCNNICRQQTHASQQISLLFDRLVRAGEQCRR
jgi:hypothetical protein